MPGIIPHLIAGCTMFIIGRYYYRSYFNNKTKEQLLLALICILSSFIPDFFLAIHYISYIPDLLLGTNLATQIFKRYTLMPYHKLTHLILIPVTITGLLTLKFLINPNRKPIWIMGLWSILLHLTMDIFIPHSTLLI